MPLKNWLLDRLEDKRYWPRIDAELTNDGTAGRPSQWRRRVPASGGALPGPTRLRRGRSGGRTGRGRVGPVPADPALQAHGPAEAGGLGTNMGLAAQEDAGKNVGDIPVPPKYTTADFLKTDYWRLRGKLDVPKERWISYPHCQTESDPTLVVGWAGWNHLQQATALVAYYDARKREGWDAKRLTPLLAGLDQLLPWIHQWHPEIDKEFGETAGQSFQTMLEHDAHELGLTLEDIRQWTADPKQTTTTNDGRTRK